MQDQTRPYPLLFEPIYKEKIWGGRALEQLGRTLPGGADTRIGESWEIADLSCTSTSGGGGGAEHSVVTNGPWAGRTIRELIQAYGDALLGPDAPRSADGGFPLLIKFLDARENLSVQVHPSPEYAAAHPDAHLKSEAWYIIDHEPGAVIYKGLRPGVAPDQLREALALNNDAAVVPLLNAVQARKGDCHYLPSGTLHALGAGVLVAEVQTPSDTTFRVYDWGRTERELHIEQAMACIDFSGASVEVNQYATERMKLTTVLKASSDYFKIEEQRSSADVALPVSQTGSEVWMMLEGRAGLLSPEEDHLELRPGQTVLMPANLSQTPYVLRAKPGSTWLRVTPG